MEFLATRAWLRSAALFRLYAEHQTLPRGPVVHIDRAIAVGFSATLLILLVVGAVAFRGTSRLVDTATAGEQNQKVLGALESELMAVFDAVAYSRAYALTGNAEYRQDYEAALQGSAQSLSELRVLVAEESEQASHLAQLESSIAARFAICAEVVHARESDGAAKAAAVIGSGQGKPLMEDIRRIVAEMRQHETARLGEGRFAAIAISRYTKSIIVIGCAAAAVLILVFLIVIRREIRQRERAMADRDLHFNSSLDMLCVAGFDGYFKQVNPSWTKTLGWSAEELTSRPWLDFVHPDDVEATVGAGNTVTSGTSLVTFENRYRCKDGSYRWISWTSQPMVEKQLIYAVARDVTERKRADERFQTLFECAPNGLLLVDASRRILLANVELARMFGYEQKELLGQTVELLVPDRIRAVHPSYVAGFMKAPKQRAMGAVPNLFGRKKDGSEIPLHVALNPIEYEGGVGVLVAIADVSERKKTEDRLRSLNNELENKSAALVATNKELEAFSYSVSHDLRAPLRAIDGFSRVLLEKFSDTIAPDAKRYLNIVRENTALMSALIDDLLAFSRLSRQAMNKRTVPVDMQVRDIIERLRPEYQGRDLKIQVDKLPPCEGDPDLLRQVWINLLSNAIKYTRNRDNATIHIGSSSNGNGHATYFVKDNGAGFDMQYSDKLFGVFQRLHRQEDYEGTGIGLATVQRIIQRHGGRIWADAKMDEGATFSFTLEGHSES